ncbi:MAG: hypothetical protein SFX73_31265 [Kofleriaceae bacterium]|nr:hypothetical protein [Kofleriaceae bacterium]
MYRWVVVIAVSLAACRERHQPAEHAFAPTTVAPGPAAVAPVDASPPCLADGLGPLVAMGTYRRKCLDAGNCAIACTDGSGDACIAHAYTVQQERDSDAAQEWFVRACKLGVANGCTNVGAYFWTRDEASPADDACGKRLFELACNAGEAFACGMFGRVLAAEAETPEQQQAARRQLDSACTTYGAMSCRMYALHLEKGELGPSDPATVRALMVRACSTGDDAACGHEKAGETFD